MNQNAQNFVAQSRSSGEQTARFAQIVRRLAERVPSMNPRDVLDLETCGCSETMQAAAREMRAAADELEQFARAVHGRCGEILQAIGNAN